MRGCNENISGGFGMIKAISVKDRLKKQAIEDGKTMQDKLITYGLESTLVQHWILIFWHNVFQMMQKK